MKYPWTAISITVIWIATTYVLIKKPGLDINAMLVITFIGTIIISLIGFRSPKIK